MKNACTILVLTLIAASHIGCNDSTTWNDQPDAWSHPLVKSEPDNRPRLPLDVGKPYRLAFGRGNGHRGLETIVIDENGRVVLHRMTYESVDGVGRVYWERGTLTLPPYAIRNPALSIRQQRILHMNRAYHADVHDGAQWIFRLVQGGQEKAIYFNNHFPNRIRRFAVILDDILKDAGIDAVTWSRVPDAEAGDHEKPIWQGIRDGAAGEGTHGVNDPPPRHQPCDEGVRAAITSVVGAKCFPQAL